MQNKKYEAIDYEAESRGIIQCLEKLSSQVVGRDQRCGLTVGAFMKMQSPSSHGENRPDGLVD